jgi:hypothetical protein
MVRALPYNRTRNDDASPWARQRRHSCRLLCDKRDGLPCCLLERTGGVERPGAGPAGLVIGGLSLLGALVVAAVVARIARRPGGGLSDEQIVQIETVGSVEVDEPLDLDTIAREEDEFWSETWDEPDEPTL